MYCTNNRASVGLLQKQENKIQTDTYKKYNQRHMHKSNDAGALLKSALAASNKIYDYTTLFTDRSRYARYTHEMTGWCIFYMLYSVNICKYATVLCVGAHYVRCCGSGFALSSGINARNRRNKRNCNISLNQSVVDAMRMEYRINTYVYIYVCCMFMYECVQ